MRSPQSQWFLLTVPGADFVPFLPEGVGYIIGQRELGAGGFDHWQICAHLLTKQTVTFVRRLFGGRAHVEPSRSAAARDYVWKEDTRVEGTQFELGHVPTRRNSQVDWELVWASATTGEISAIPAQLRVCHYRSLRTIQSDYAKTPGMVRDCSLYWGRTGTGKTF